jgi:hypothetical protein
MRMNAKLVSEYPKLATFLQKVLPNVVHEKKTFDAMKKHSGATSATIQQGLGWRNGPEIQVVMLVPRQVGGHTETPTGGYRLHSNIIQVGTADVGRFQTGQDVRHTRVGQVALLKIILLHELTHWAREQSKTAETDGVEDGFAFEKEAYGEVIS